MEFERTLRVTLWVGGMGWGGGGVLLHSEMPQGSLGLGRAVEIPTDSGMLTTCRPWGASHPHVTQPNSANEVVWKFSQLFQPFHESCPPSGVCHLPELREIPSL